MPHLLIHTHVTSLNILRKCPTLPAESNKQKKCIMPLHSGIYNTWGNLLYIFDIVHSQSETYQIGPLSRNCEFSCLTPHTTIIPHATLMSKSTGYRSRLPESQKLKIFIQTASIDHPKHLQIIMCSLCSWQHIVNYCMGHISEK